MATLSGSPVDQFGPEPRLVAPCGCGRTRYGNLAVEQYQSIGGAAPPLWIVLQNVTVPPYTFQTVGYGLLCCAVLYGESAAGPGGRLIPFFVATFEQLTAVVVDLSAIVPRHEYIAALVSFTTSAP